MQKENLKRFSFKDFIIVNGIFWVYCAIQLVLIKIFVGELTGMVFFFGVLAIGFTVVYFFNFFFDLFYKGEDEELIFEKDEDVKESDVAKKPESSES